MNSSFDFEDPENNEIFEVLYDYAPGSETFDANISSGYRNATFVPDRPNSESIPDRRNGISLPLPSQSSRNLSRKKYILALKLFKDKKNRPPKREYFRTKLIRGHKRAIRHVLSKKIPTKTSNSVDINSKDQYTAWCIFKNFVNEHKFELEEISRTSNGPGTDGKCRRPSKNASDKTFNDNFCSIYFKNPFVKTSFIQYIDFLFSEIDCDLLNKRFDLKCCKLSSHLTCCSENWLALKNQLKTEFIQVHLPQTGTQEVVYD